jgi:hypothetical protein
MSSLYFYFAVQVFFAFGAGFALWKGNRGERLAAVVVATNVAIGIASQWLGFGHVEIIRFCNDGLAAVALLVITMRYGAFWMGGVMLFYAAQFSLHAFYLVTDRPQDRLYAIVNNVDWYGVIWALIIGTAVAWRHRVRAARRALQAAP